MESGAERLSPPLGLPHQIDRKTLSIHMTEEERGASQLPSVVKQNERRKDGGVASAYAASVIKSTVMTKWQKDHKKNKLKTAHYEPMSSHGPLSSCQERELWEPSRKRKSVSNAETKAMRDATTRSSHH